jgi:hypothetical protein
LILTPCYLRYLDELEEEDGGKINPLRMNMISRIKIARHKAINKAVEEKLTKADLVKEKM